MGTKVFTRGKDPTPTFNNFPGSEYRACALARPREFDGIRFEFDQCTNMEDELKSCREGAMAALTNASTP